MRNVLGSWWAEPRAPNNPGILRRDWWLVFAVVVSAVVEGIFRVDVVLRPLAILLAVGLAFTLPWRRTHPLTVVVINFAAITVMNVVAIARSDPSFGLYTMAFILLLPYALVRWGSEREILVGLGVILVGFGTGIAADFENPGEAVAGIVFAMTPAFIGAAVRYRTTSRARAREEAVLKVREQLARELHDTVAHHVSAIAIQAQAGKALAPANPKAPLQALEIIEVEASRTLAEMRAIVGTLRQGEEAELTPLPGLSEITRLARAASDGPQVNVRFSGDLDDLAPAVDTAIYRLAQESITNAIRHARHATSVDVSVTDDGDYVTMTVSDDGEPHHVAGQPEPGFGLVGMSERVKLLGGHLKAGPGPERGWAVTAVIPKGGPGQ